MSEEYKYDFKFKLVVIGDGEVGKSSLIQKYTSGSFNTEYIKTIGAQFSRYERVVDNIRSKLFLWDIAGQKEFSFMRQTFYNGTSGVIIVFDLSKPETLDSVLEWYNDVSKYCGMLPTIVFGNKSDLLENPDEYDETKIKEIMAKYEFLGFYKTSAKTGAHVQDSFNKIIDNLIKNYIDKQEK